MPDGFDRSNPVHKSIGCPTLNTFAVSASGQAWIRPSRYGGAEKLKHLGFDRFILVVSCLFLYQ